MDTAVEAEMRRLEAALTPHLTEAFLATLVMAARTCGDTVDWVELWDFVQWCHHTAGRDIARKMDPYVTP